jgi:hypothetical protein
MSDDSKQFNFKVYEGFERTAWLRINRDFTMEEDLYEFDANGLANLISKATAALSQMKVPTINEHEVLAEGRSAPPKGK